ncbi:CyP450 monooxygenase [Fomitiporia mediterranea MF3/22]|uniref:CyP450 monooxygenase n=1 Tax=Fomitiporia mediterranea (strain MF3/22) TaxID=694068 RepID=UPI0004407FAC|nr:CyP450 monooxygenase [Fomitiporia mediterranea MF3/22]EJC99663.1 CyP450 monooxygenase [Fomitiporia mediterranea MF3/22]
MPYHVLDTIAIACVPICLWQFFSWRKSCNRSPLPPGPKGLPLIGNTLDVPEVEEWEAARKWGEEHGPVVHIKHLGISYVFLNSYQAAVDLFEKRWSNYSCRPKLTMWELESFGWFVPVMPYGDELRRARQLMHRFFQPAVVVEYTEMQTHVTHKMLQSLLNAPDSFPELVKHAAGETILKMTYGYQVAERDDPYVALGIKGLDAFAEAEGLFLVNAFPWLRYLPDWFPGAQFKKIAKEGLKNSLDMYYDQYKLAKQKYAEGSVIPSMSSKLIEASMAHDAVLNDEMLIAKVTSTAYGAGADTTVSVLHSFFLAMVLYPEVQQRAQEELDKVVGKDTLPSFDDRQNLPYLNSIIKETYRWQIIAPLATAHTAAEDDVYNGYFIPAGTIVFQNLWAITRDPTTYPNPDEFIPERWLPGNGKEPPSDVHKIVFGIGRRICPGRHFADNAVFIGAASLLAAFNIAKALDEHGVPITPDQKYYTHMIRHPKPFKYSLTPRSEKIASIIHQSVEAMK